MICDQTAFVSAAADKTVAAGLVRVTWTTRFHTLEARALNSLNWLERAVVGTLSGFARRVANLEGEGFADFASRRCVLDYASSGMRIESRRQWSGHSGAAVGTPKTQKLDADSPLWLFDLLHGVHETSELPGEPLHDRPARRFRAVSDLGLVSSAAPFPTALPNLASYEELRALEFEVWVGGDGYVRRISFEPRVKELTLDLLDFGVTDPVDWSRLPSVKPAP